MLVRSSQALGKAETLLLVGDHECNLDEGEAVVHQTLLEAVDFVVTCFPYLLLDKIVDARDKNIFVVRTVEDADLARLGKRLLNSPQIVVGELFFGRNAKG